MAASAHDRGRPGGNRTASQMSNPTDDLMLRLADAFRSHPDVRHPRSRRDHEMSWWLRTRLASIDRDAINGRLRACAHVPAAPGIVALWAPDTVLCLECVAATRVLLVDPAEEWRCDRCAELVDKAAGEDMTIGAIGARSAVVWFGLCLRCAAREGAA